MMFVAHVKFPLGSAHLARAFCSSLHLCSAQKSTLSNSSSAMGKTVGWRFTALNGDRLARARKPLGGTRQKHANSFSARTELLPWGRLAAGSQSCQPAMLQCLLSGPPQCSLTLPTHPGRQVISGASWQFHQTRCQRARSPACN